MIRATPCLSLCAAQRDRSLLCPRAVQRSSVRVEPHRSGIYSAKTGDCVGRAIPKRARCRRSLAMTAWHVNLNHKPVARIHPRCCALAGNAARRSSSMKAAESALACTVCNSAALRLSRSRATRYSCGTSIVLMPGSSLLRVTRRPARNSCGNGCVSYPLTVWVCTLLVGHPNPSNGVFVNADQLEQLKAGDKVHHRSGDALDVRIRTQPFACICRQVNAIGAG